VASPGRAKPDSVGGDLLNSFASSAERLNNLAIVGAVEGGIASAA
jgi:hypothetical protein